MTTATSAAAPERATSLLRRFLGDRRGSLAVSFGFLSVPMVMITGMAVDYSRVAYARTSLQAVVDSTALSIANPRYNDPEQIRAAAVSIFESQLREKLNLAQVPKLEVSVLDDGKSVHVKAMTSVSTTLLAILGMSEMEIAAQAKGIRGLDNNVELALVLDTTGSMLASNKLQTLKTSANLLVDTLTADASAKVKFAIVPFANYVNVGLANRNQAWLSNANDYSTTTSSQSCTTPNTTCKTWTTQPKQTCVSVNCVPKQTCTTNDGVQTCKTTQQCQQQCTTTGTQQVCSEWNKGPQQCTTKVTTTNYKWSGCVQSRPSPNHITDANPALPYAALMNQTCASPIVPLTDNKTVVKAAINALSATGETYIPGGLIWGLNVLSPLAPFSEGGAYDAQNRKPRKALVLMTDGVNTKSLNGTMHTGSNRATADTATTQLCAAVKGRGIEVFTVAFMVTDTGVQTMLKSCASSGENYFNAADAASLEAAFKKIALALQTPYLGL
ncbi:MAG: pilus assembly protein TadG-related protein [Alsobacter sp.]